MSLNIALVASLFATVSCSDSKKSNPSSTEPDLTGYWRTACEVEDGDGYASKFIFVEITEDGQFNRHIATYTNSSCTGDVSVSTAGFYTIEVGNVSSTSPWTADIDINDGEDIIYTTAKYESETLKIAECPVYGVVPERCASFTNSTAFTSLAPEDVPETTPVK